MTCYNIGLSCLMGKNKKEKENKRSGCGGLSQKKKKKKSGCGGDKTLIIRGFGRFEQIGFSFHFLLSLLFSRQCWSLSPLVLCLSFGPI